MRPLLNAAIVLVLAALAAGCRSQSTGASSDSTPSAQTPDIDAAIAQATAAHHPLLVLVIETGHSPADAQALAAYDALASRDNDAVLQVLLDLAISRNRATAARFHVTDTPLMLCLSPRGLIISRDEKAITQDLMLKRIKEVERHGPHYDQTLASLEEGAASATDSGMAEFALAHYLLRRENALEAIPHLEAVAHGEATPPALRVRAWVELARAHLWIAEPEKARHEALALIGTLGPTMPEAQAGGMLVMGIQDAHANRDDQAMHEFKEAVKAAPHSTYGKEASEALTLLPKGGHKS